MQDKDIISIHERITKLETLLNDLIVNHMPHLEEAIKLVNKKFWAVIMLLLTNLVALIVMLIIK